MLQHLVIAGVIVNIVGVWGYIRDTFKGKTQPNRMTWLLWSVIPVIAATAAIAKGVTWAAVPVAASSFLPFLIFLASFANRNGYWKLGAFDYFCGALSMVAIILWALTKNPVVAIAFSILADWCAAWPTYIKSWKSPETESGIAYTTGAFAALTGILAVHSWTFPEYGFPLYLLINCLIVTVLVYRKRSPRGRSKGA